MIRKRNGKDITDEEFFNIILPFENVLEEYFINNIIYEFVAFYLARDMRWVHYENVLYNIRLIPL